MRFKTVLILIIISLTFSSCVYKTLGPEIYDVETNDSFTQEQIEKYNIKYIAKSRELFWADVSRKKGVYAINVYNNDGKIHYTQLKESFVQKLEIEPRYSFWNKYGKYFTIPLTIIIVFISIVIFLSKLE